MKNNLSKKILSIFLIVSILSHMTYLHSILDEYVLCYGNDGHLAIENLGDDEECSNLDKTNFIEFNSAVYFDYDECTDYPIIDGCFEDSEFLLDKRVDIQILRIADIEYLHEPHNNDTKKPTWNLTIPNNNILVSYTTVSLLI